MAVARRRRTALDRRCSSPPTASPYGWLMKGDPVSRTGSRVGLRRRQTCRSGRQADLTWELAWQSAGRTEEPWIGPDLLADMRRVADAGATVSWSARWVRLGPPRDPLRPRHRSSRGGSVARSGPSPGRLRFNDDPAFHGVLASAVRIAERRRRQPGQPAPAVTRLRRPGVTRPPAPNRCHCRCRHCWIGGGLGAGCRTGAGRAPPHVVHVFEADDRVGGKLARPSSPGVRWTWPPTPSWPTSRSDRALPRARVDRRAGSRRSRGASMWARHRPAAMPQGLNLGVPTRWVPLARSGILGPAESLRARRTWFSLTSLPPW